MRPVAAPRRIEQGAGGWSYSRRPAPDARRPTRGARRKLGFGLLVQVAEVRVVIVL